MTTAPARYVLLERKDRSASLSSWITSTMNMLHAAVATGFTAHVHWPAHRCPGAYHDEAAFALRPNMFDWYFDQWWCPAPPAFAVEKWVGDDIAIVRDHPIDDYWAFYARYLVFNAEVRARFEALLARHALRPEKTVAIAWRGTDSVVDGRPAVPMESFFSRIDALLEAEPDLAIVAKPEERGAADALRARYPRAIVPAEFFIAETGEPQMQDWVHPAPGFERGMEAMLLILLFSRCRYLLKNDSNLSDVATRLSTGTVIAWATATRSYIQRLATP